jgi:toxin ParE1/3/4
MAKLEWTERALDDLQQIRIYIARDSGFYAKAFVSKIYQRVQVLERSPEIGRMVPEMEDPAIRELIFQSYRIIYEYNEKTVKILTVIHGRRLLRF